MPSTTPIKNRKRSRRPVLTPEQREQRQQEQRDRLDQAVAALRTSEGWQKWMQSRRLFRSRSFNNQLLIALQRPDATRVLGYGDWQKLNRQVRKGETSIKIFAPRLVAERDPATNEKTGRRKCVGFLVVSVFDVAQTDPTPGCEPMPLDPPSQPITGDSHAELIAPLTALARETGFSIELRDLSDRPEGGWCDAQAKQIVVDSSQPANAQVRIVVHEIAHALGVGYQEFGRCQAEVIVDATTYCVLDALALDVSSETVPYLAGWGAEHTSDYLRTHAALIDKLAKRIEDACTGVSVREPDTNTQAGSEAVAA